MREVRINFGVVVLLVLAIMTVSLVAGDPNGATLTEGPSGRGTDPSATQQTAVAGNVTQLDIDQTRLTDVWQGFYGNVTGEIVLEDGGSNRFYDWSYASTQGEVYATRFEIADWSGINCTNSTQWEAEETTLNIVSDAVDGINETYNDVDHPAFSVGDVDFTTDLCQSTRPYNSSGTAGDFYNVLLSVNDTTVVYTSVLASGADGFNSNDWDFEILVPTDRTTGTASYYFYVELGA